MDLYQELLLTLLISILLTFLLAELSTVPPAANPVPHEFTSLPGPAAAGGRPARTGQKRVRFRDVEGKSEPPRGESSRSVYSVDIPLDGEDVGEMTAMAEIEKAEPETVRSLPGGETEIVGLMEETLVDEEGGEDDIGAGSLLQGEDEWEGIERSEPERLFGVATAYINSAAGSVAVSGLSNDVQMQLYGLRKVATEGPCYEPQPLALKVTARAKWYAWQRLGNMNPEVAMENYISLLSHSIPGWMGEKPGNESNDPPVQRVIGTGTPDSSSYLHSQLGSKIGRELEYKTEGDNSSADAEHSQ